jgi:phosphoglycolate phosphatase
MAAQDSRRTSFSLFFFRGGQTGPDTTRFEIALEKGCRPAARWPATRIELEGSIARFSEIRALIFDLDGTLIDSKLDLALSVNATLAEFGRVPLPHDQIFSYVGQGAPALIARALGSDASEEDRALGLEFFVKYYSAHKLDNTALYPGVREALDALNGMPMAVYTNKPVRVSRNIIEELGMALYFRFVYGGNSFERKKPDPMGIDSILRELGAAPMQAMIVGDSEIDIQTARNAGTWVCGVTYGFGSHRFTEYPPDLLVDNLTELVPHLFGSSASHLV